MKHLLDNKAIRFRRSSSFHASTENLKPIFNVGVSEAEAPVHVCT